MIGKRALTRTAKRRLARAVPIVGIAFAVAHAAQKIKTKGYVRGGIDVALDLTPVVGRVKAIYEFFRGDLLGPTADERVTDG
jgi:hypothetical protein